MRLVLLGVRGSTPAPGAPFVRYGGHTSAVAVLGDADQVPALILDAGTGLRSLTGLLDGEAFRGDVVLSHLHWDHVQGLPFAPALDRPDAEVRLHLPGRWNRSAGSDDARQLLATVMSPPHFPIGPDGLQGCWAFSPARPGRWVTDGGAVITLASVEHKGGCTYGIRVELDGASVAYLPDHLQIGQPADDAADELVAGVDVLLHDGQFTAAERPTAADYGHATIDDVLDLADRCGVGRLVLIHHAPTRSDDELDALAARFTTTPQGRAVHFAWEGQVLDVRPADRAPEVAVRFSAQQ